MLRLIERGVAQRYVSYDLLGNILAGVGVGEPCNDTSLEQMLGDYLVYVLRLYSAVEGSVGVYDDDGT